VSAPIWIAGLVFYVFVPAGRRYRALGWTWLIVFLLLASSKATRGAYLAPAYTWLLAGGGVAIERVLRRFGTLVRAGVIGVTVAQGLVVAPVVLPIFSQATLEAYSLKLEGSRRAEEKSGIHSLPEFLSHMSDWGEIVQTIAVAYARIPEAERGSAIIFAPNYGVAGAIDVLGPPLGLPHAISGHNSYWLWGTRGLRGDVALVMGVRETRLRQWFDEITQVGEIRCAYCQPYEDHRIIWLARRPRMPLDALWPALQQYQ
jgi:hypothetical protein